MQISTTQKKVAIAIAIAAVAYVAYKYYTKDDKKVVSPTPVNPFAKYEGKTLTTSDASGNYNGGWVVKVVNGKKIPLNDTEFKSFLDDLVSGGYNRLVFVSQSVLDSIPTA